MGRSLIRGPAAAARGVALAALLTVPASAGPASRGLDVYWIDVEGGAATLIVTPAGESVLVDAGNPGERDASRIHRVATEVAGLSRIDHLVVTHFHRDHFGGVAELARRMHVAVLYERELASAPESERSHPDIATYRAAAVGRREIVRPGLRLPLRQAPGTAALFLDVLGSDGTFVKDFRARINPACRAIETREADTSDNRNSVVLRLALGAFRLFDGGDLTWNAEADLVCPRDRVGPVDVLQVDHHGLDRSNNPVLVRTLAPTVAVVNNGPRKGNEAETVATLRTTSSIRAVYQVHRDVRADERNTARERIANWDESCGAEYVKLAVESDGWRYTVSVPATGHQASFKSRARKGGAVALSQEAAAKVLEEYQDRLAQAEKQGPAKLAEAFRKSPPGVGVHEIDTNMRLIRVSPEELKLLGYREEQVVGRPVWEMIVMQDASKRAMEQKLKGEKELKPFVRSFRRADGSAIALLLADRHIRDFKGTIVGIRTAMVEVKPL